MIPPGDGKHSDTVQGKADQDCNPADANPEDKKTREVHHPKDTRRRYLHERRIIFETHILFNHLFGPSFSAKRYLRRAVERVYSPAQ